MNFAILALSGLRRHPLRMSMIFLSAVVAFFLLGIMSGVVTAMGSLVDSLNDNRLRTVSRAGFGEDLPVAHIQRIREVEGIRTVASALAFPGYFQDPANTFGGAAISLESYLGAFPELTLPNTERERLLSIRNSATVGESLAQRFGWQVGDVVPLTSTYLVNKDGSKTWPVEIAAIHNRGSEAHKILANEIYLNLDYVDEYRVDEPGRVHMFVVLLDGSVPMGSLINSIDSLFKNSGDETNSFSEKAFFLNRVQQIGDISTIVRSILAAVFFSLMIVLATNLAQSINQRQREFATLKSLGFTTSKVISLVFVEVLILVGMAAFTGLVLASVVFPILFGAVAILDTQFASTTWFAGIGLACGLAVIVTVRPGWVLTRLQPAQVLARG